MHSAQASHPRVVSFSLRNQLDMIAHITTERAPSGVLSVVSYPSEA
jgi:hypothetical protein